MSQENLCLESENHWSILDSQFSNELTFHFYDRANKRQGM